MRLWKEREAGLEQAQEDTQGFLGVVSAESHTHLNAQNDFRNLPRQDFIQCGLGPVCFRASSRLGLRQLPRGPTPDHPDQPLGPSVAGICICSQLLRCLPCDTAQCASLSAHTGG